MKRIVYFCVFGLSCLAENHSYTINLFKADSFLGSPVQQIASRLGLQSSEFIVEDFESEQLADGVRSEVQGGRESEDGVNPNAWDGRCASVEQNAAKFEMQQEGVRLFGIGLGDNDFGQEKISVNGNSAIELYQRPNHRCTSTGKAYYLVLTAADGEPDIRSVEFSNGYTIAFDHLIFAKRGGEIRDQSGAQDDHLRLERLNAMARRISAPELPAKTISSGGVPSPVRDVSGILLLAPEGQPFLGNQLKLFNQPEPGVIGVEKPSWLYLYWTEGRDFTLSGEVWLGGEYAEMIFPGDLPDGFALFLREWDGIHRYQLDSRQVIAKRRLLKGSRQDGIQQVGELPRQPGNRWIPFRVSASQTEIVYALGNATARLDGPLDIDGGNKVMIAPGTRLRNLRLAFEATAPASLMEEAEPLKSELSRQKIQELDERANAIANGGFEETSGNTGDDTGQFGEMMFSPGSQLLPGWSVSDGLVGLRDNLPSPSGGHVLELGPRDTPGTVTQEIRTQVGKLYTLSFYASGGRPGGNRGLRIRAGDLDKEIECAVPGYERVALPFRADSVTTRVSIGGVGQAGFGPMIDDIRVEEDRR